MNELVRIDVDTDLAEMVENIKASRSVGTRRRYESAWGKFVDWCLEAGEQAMPASPETVGRYITVRARTNRPSSVAVDLTAISHYHQAADQQSPVQSNLVRRAMEGIKRINGTDVKQRAALTTNLLQKLIAAMSDDLQGKRDKALLLIGFAAGGRRRSEIVALNVEHIRRNTRGLIIRIERTKTDQEAHGTDITVLNGRDTSLCPVRALDTYLLAAGITEGAVWRRVRRGGHVTAQRLNAAAVYEIVRKWAGAAGLDAKDYGAHSLRAGMATEAALRKVPLADIALFGGWRSPEMPLRYIRHADPFASSIDLGL